MNNKSEAAKKRWADPEYRRKVQEGFDKRGRKSVSNKYSKTKVYKLLDKDKNTIYIGTALGTLGARLRLHIKDSFKKDSLICKKIKECPEDISIELVEELCCESKEEKQKIEQIYLEKEIEQKNRFLLNTNRAHKDGKRPLNKNTGDKGSDYYKQNREERLEYANEYYKQNRERVLEYQKKYEHNKRYGIV